jgi:hypothetical protein
MKFTKGITGVLALTATVAFASALSAQTLQVLTAGSSAQFGPFAVAAWALATNGGATAYHYTVKSGSCSDTTGINPSTITTANPSGTTTKGFGSGSSCYAYLFDQRNGAYNSTTGTSTDDIAPEPGNLWVVWNTNNQVWAYLSVDSTVGVRAFQAVPRALLELNLPTSGQSAYNAYFDGKADSSLAITGVDVSTALKNVALTAANTDIRPEDALFATNRTLNTLEYATSAGSLIGNAIDSAFGTSPAVAHPVSFAVSGGTDPISGKTVPTILTLPIGAAPVIFLANTTNLSSATNITSANAASLFSGTGNCVGNLLSTSTGTISSSVALNPILREPLSGTMNTVDYSVFTLNGSSQETGINDDYQAPTYSDINPLKLPCGSGYRYRAVGTGDEVKAVQATASGYSGVTATTNNVGYAFFSYEALAPSSSYEYLELNSIDPLAYTTSSGTTSTYSGSLPSCATSSTTGAYDCPIVAGGSFLNLRNGSYPAWSVYRLITDSTGQTNAQTLVSKAQKLVNSSIPDFVPFTPVCRLTASGKDDPGLDVYRAHFTISGVTADDGPLNATVSCTTGGSHTLKYYTLGGQDSTGANNEAGGDVGGAIQGPFNSTTGQPTVPGVTQTSTH